VRTILVVALAVAVGCGGSVKVMGSESPSYPGALHRHEHREHPEGSLDLPSDEQIVEPEHPLVDSKPERATVHVHTPKRACSGVVMGPRVVVTARQCVGADRGAYVVDPKEEYKVEVASSSLTWTTRRVTHVITGGCDWEDLDVAALVLSEPVAWVAPLKIVSAPGTGAKVTALGFGRCGRNRIATVLSGDSDDFVIDTPLCKGDVGGPVIDGHEEIVGLVSHQDDPEGSPRKTTTIARIDTTPAREILAAAERAAKGADVTKDAPVACK
jgi:hypothetical protein